jgi:hypothetical protein
MSLNYLVWVATVALIPHNPVFALNQALFLSNPIQAYLYQFIKTDVFCYAVENDYMSKLPKALFLDGEDKYTHCKRIVDESNSIKRDIEAHCGLKGIHVPDFPSFYFQVPSVIYVKNENF